MPRHADPALEALWRRRMRQQPLSRLTIQQFCKREGVSTAAFHAWKRRLALRAAFPTTPAAPPAFVPVVVPAVHESQPRGATELLTIRLANGGQILLPITADVALVREVVATVARCSAAREGAAC
jgi:acetaldehyde dehydrogenase (acetylating)